MQTLASDGRLREFSVHPLALLAIAFAAGILGALYLVISLSLLIMTAAITTLFANAALVTSTRVAKQGKIVYLRKLAVLLVTFTTLLLGATLAKIERDKVPANQLKRLINEGVVAVGEPVELTGVLMRDPEVAPDRLFLQLRVEQIRSRAIQEEASGHDRPAATLEREVSGVVVLLAAVPTKAVAQEFAQVELRYGARIRVMMILERADEFRNPVFPRLRSIWIAKATMPPAL